MDDLAAFANRTPSRASRRLATVAQFTALPFTRFLPWTRAELLLLRAASEAACVVAGYDHLEHTEVRTRFAERPVRGEWVGGVPAAGSRIMYYLHGSAYAVCSPRTHRPLVTSLGRRTGRAVFSLDYRLGPEYRFPAGFQDAVNGYLWLLDQGYRPEDVVVAGDSAGGHLALALCGELRRRGLAQPAGLVLFSPLVDGTFETAAAARKRTHDPTATARAAKRIIGHHLKSADRSDPRFDVVREAGPDLPPMLIQAGGREMMSADAELFDRAQREAGGHCELQVWPGQLHVFQMMGLPESHAALDEVQRFVAELDQQRAAVAG